jgi:hypothetical protein
MNLRLQFWKRRYDCTFIVVSMTSLKSHLNAWVSDKRIKSICNAVACHCQKYISCSVTAKCNIVAEECKQ